VDTDIGQLARAAYATGWAASGGPMTARVRAGCVAAVASARERPDDPHVLEVTVDLGRLEGMWALLFQRREEQQQHHTQLVAAAWIALFDDATIDAVLRELRSHPGLLEADHDPARTTKALATAAAAALLRALGDYGRWDNLRRTLRDALAAGRTEGIVNAVAIAAEQADVQGLDWSTAAADAYASLGSLEAAWADSSPWLARLIAAAAAHLARVLIGAADADTAARADLGDPDNPAVADTVDWAMTDAADRGAADLYRTYGAAQLSIITAGDGRVCAECENAEDGSPYPADAAPVLPMHPRCRCVYSADIDLSPFADWFL
jgi:hypothetical protein